jgi:hypothetical protein
MHDPSDIGELAVEPDVRFRVRRRVEVSFHLFPVEIHDDHVCGREIVVVHAAGLDGHQSE